MNRLANASAKAKEKQPQPQGNACSFTFAFVPEHQDELIYIFEKSTMSHEWITDTRININISNN